MRTNVLGVLALVICLAGFAMAGVLGSNLNPFSAQDASFEISVDNAMGTNRYVMIEVDEGDNDEEEVVTEILHQFLFSASASDGMITWDFGDGEVRTGASVTHEFSEPGHHDITATLVTSEDIETRSISVVVDLESEVEADNMECVCAPTAKDTVIVLATHASTSALEGFVQVEHDGSSESCSLRNPLQECHVRVILQKLEEGSVIEQEVLFDDTFRSNEYIVDFLLEDVGLEEGQSMQLRLETDQVRDWHKPTAAWATSVM